MTTDYLADRRDHLARCRSKLAELGQRIDPDNDRFALVAWGAWTPGKRPSTRLAILECPPSGTHKKDLRVWGRVEVFSSLRSGKIWAKFVRSFERETVLATFWACPSVPMLKAVKKGLPRIPEGTA